MLLHVVWNAPCAQEDSHCTQAFQLELPQKFTGIHHCLLSLYCSASLQNTKFNTGSERPGHQAPNCLAIGSVTLAAVRIHLVIAASDPLILEVPGLFVGSILIRHLIQHRHPRLSALC